MGRGAVACSIPDVCVLVYMQGAGRPGVAAGGKPLYCASFAVFPSAPAGPESRLALNNAASSCPHSQPVSVPARGLLFYSFSVPRHRRPGSRLVYTLVDRLSITGRCDLARFHAAPAGQAVDSRP